MPEKGTRTSKGRRTAAIPEFSPVYIIYGAEGFLKRQALDELLHRLRPDADSDLAGVTRLEGPAAQLSDVLDELRTFSLLGGRRIVVLEEADAFITNHRERLEKYCDHPCATGVLILLAKSSPSNTRLHKAVDAMGGCIKCEPKKGAELDRWITDHARAQFGKRIGREAVSALRELADPSLAILDSELCKLATYVGTREEITGQDVEALVGHHRPETIFEVTDAMARGDAAAALTRWDQTLATNRAAGPMAVGGLAWGLRRLLEARHLLEGGTPIGSVAGQLRLPPEVLHRLQQRYTLEDLEDQLLGLSQADLNSKTGLGDIESAIELLIVRHGHAGA